MKVLITGGSGQLGQDCHRCFRDRHWCRAYPSHELDITDSGQVREIFDREQPEVVVNCAAYAAVDGCESARQRCWLVNGEGPAILARECARLGSRLIHISTDYVFDGRKPVPEPYLEDDPTGPICQYGHAKLAGEQKVAEILTNHLIVRTAWLYGMGGRNFLKTILRLALDPSRAQLKVVDDQYGSLTWTWRLAQQLAPLLDAPLTGIAHATAEGFSTWYQVAATFLGKLNIDKSVIPCATAEYPTPARRPANSILENHCLKATGLHLMRPWQEDLAAFVQAHGPALKAEALAALAD